MVTVAQKALFDRTTAEILAKVERPLSNSEKRKLLQKIHNCMAYSCFIDQTHECLKHNLLRAKCKLIPNQAEIKTGCAYFNTLCPLLSIAPHLPAIHFGTERFSPQIAHRLNPQAILHEIPQEFLALLPSPIDKKIEIYSSLISTGKPMDQCSLELLQLPHGRATICSDEGFDGSIEGPSISIGAASHPRFGLFAAVYNETHILIHYIVVLHSPEHSRLLEFLKVDPPPTSSSSPYEVMKTLKDEEVKHLFPPLFSTFFSFFLIDIVSIGTRTNKLDRFHALGDQIADGDPDWIATYFKLPKEWQLEICNVLIKKPRELFGAQGIWELISSQAYHPIPLQKDREWRVRDCDETIDAKLAKAWQRAQKQCRKELPPIAYSLYCDTPLPDGQNDCKALTIDNYQVGLCSLQSKRDAMEDAHLATSFQLPIGDQIHPVQLFGVFDGHGGNRASQFMARELTGIMREALLEHNPSGLSKKGIWNALKIAFVRANDRFLEISHRGGTTATVVMILDGNVWTANVGDSRTILDNAGECIQLSKDDKPEGTSCQRIIQNRGGSVLPDRHNDARIHGILAVGKSIGNGYLKGAKSARPSITCMPLSQIRPHAQIALVCDGVTAIRTSREIAQMLYNHKDMAVEDLAKGIALDADADPYSHDNITALIVRCCHPQ